MLTFWKEGLSWAMINADFLWFFCSDIAWSKKLQNKTQKGAYLSYKLTKLNKLFKLGDRGEGGDKDGSSHEGDGVGDGDDGVDIGDRGDRVLNSPKLLWTVQNCYKLNITTESISLWHNHYKRC